jgi:ABC-type lipoprotein release transport system permease subunit
MAQYWKHGDALGGRVTFADHPKEEDWSTVIGIVGDVKDTPKDAGAQASFWWPMAQGPFSNSLVAIRSTLDPAFAADCLRAAVRELDGNLAISDIRTMKEVAAGAYSTSRFALLLVVAFLAVSLAAIGTYGVIAYSVNQRIHEFGVRLALGAQPWDVVATELLGGMRLALVGTLIGVPLGLALSQFLGNLLYGVSSIDPVAILATCATAIVVAALACFRPAMRATRADPMQALRAE